MLPITHEFNNKEYNVRVKEMYMNEPRWLSNECDFEDTVVNICLK